MAKPIKETPILTKRDEPGWVEKQPTVKRVAVPVNETPAYRFKIKLIGVPILGFESEVHISDSTNEDTTIVIRSGYNDKQPTLTIANEILNLLNHEKAK